MWLGWIGRNKVSRIQEVHLVEPLEDPLQAFFRKPRPGVPDAEQDPINRCLSVATHCLYGLTEAAVLAAGYAPAIGFLHTGKPLSFVYDIADLFKFETVVPIAFKVVASSCGDPVRETRIPESVRLYFVRTIQATSFQR